MIGHPVAYNSKSISSLNSSSSSSTMAESFCVPASGSSSSSSKSTSKKSSSEPTMLVYSSLASFSDPWFNAFLKMFSLTTPNGSTDVNCVNISLNKKVSFSLGTNSLNDFPSLTELITETFPSGLTTTSSSVKSTSNPPSSDSRKILSSSFKRAVSRSCLALSPFSTVDKPSGVKILGIGDRPKVKHNSLTWAGVSLYFASINSVNGVVLYASNSLTDFGESDSRTSFMNFIKCLLVSRESDWSVKISSLDEDIFPKESFSKVWKLLRDWNSKYLYTLDLRSSERRSDLANITRGYGLESTWRTLEPCQERAAAKTDSTSPVPQISTSHWSGVVGKAGSSIPARCGITDGRLPAGIDGLRSAIEGRLSVVDSFLDDSTVADMLETDNHRKRLGGNKYSRDWCVSD
ncbi:hypothetical protein OGAPHI_007416 [Ogataea philodendri]|uniref:Uncharacterized protein n=1 Tax=Ogataea philodendri TaxID=1378263 RepID=A0A9P8SZA5_9ASCO|nr:uncharacterized protein OGAPHI_007416 [Ogataea philodendri]KAH3660211.1 hypothetical protein OGAPHI_007416 [Ogataea philodendri]